MVFLHGVLHITVHGAKDLPDLDNSWFSRAKNKTDPYCTVELVRREERDDGKRDCIAKTRVIFDTLNPSWDETFRLDVCHRDVRSILFDVRDLDFAKEQDLGMGVEVRAFDIANNSDGVVEEWYPLIDHGGKPCGSIQLSVRYEAAATQDDDCGDDDEAAASTLEVPDAVFPMRRNCHVKLYQDAHAPAVPPLTDVTDCRTGEPHLPNCTWVDICAAIENAQKFIYIVGWSVKADLALIRPDLEHYDDCQEETLGHMLKRKASEDGVRVLLMVWNEALSSDMYPPGLMCTHDEATRQYFEGSGVECVLAPRTKSDTGMVERVFTTSTYTHHQKCVIVDAEIGGDEDEDGRRRIVAFAGGIDLTDGRYDTPAHPLFCTLRKQHRHDHYNGICSSSGESGPREPWHDIHLYVEGAAARDILTNFMERWRCQATDLAHGRLFIPTEEEFDLEWGADDGKDSVWNVQFFRSINADSADFGHDDIPRLLTRKGRLYENSIQMAYVHHIRRAKKFLYVENQYFLGSAHGWRTPETNCPHLVPIEIASRIVRAIRAGEMFRAYVVIPIHPEGDPTSAAVQEILHWQHRTMEMMYGMIAEAMNEVAEDLGEDAHPTDYLTFFCLGKREGPEEVDPDGELQDPDPEVYPVAAKVRESLRFMIYVHSKMAIFDDTYVIVGSANINERSMSGNRDSEMALGAYQPAFVGDNAEGDVKTFRMSLWAEHCGEHIEEHLDPSSADCMAKMREIGSSNLEAFLDDGLVEHSDCHLLLYPLTVKRDGRVLVRGDCREFPDTGGSVVGKNSNFLPNKLTT